MGDIVSLVEKAAQTIDAAQAAKMAEKMRKGVFDLNDLSDQLAQIEKIGGMGGIMGMLPGMAKMKDQLAAANLDDKVDQAPARDHLLDDAAGAAQPRHPQGLAQEAHRGRRGRQCRAGQPAAQAASPDGRHDEGDGRLGGQARHDGQARPDDGHGRRHAACRRPEQIEAMQKQIGGAGAPPGCQRRRPSRRAAARRLQPAAAISRACRASAARSCRASAAASIRSGARRSDAVVAL